MSVNARSSVDRQEMILKKQRGEPSKKVPNEDNNPFKLPASRYGERGCGAWRQRRRVGDAKECPPSYEDAVDDYVLNPRQKFAAKNNDADDTQQYIRQRSSPTGVLPQPWLVSRPRKEGANLWRTTASRAGSR